MIYELIHLQINEKIIKVFSFLESNPTRVLRKGKHYFFTYFQPLGVSLSNFSYKGVTVAVNADDRLEDLQAEGWKLIRDLPIGLAKIELVTALGDLEQTCLKQARRGTGLLIDGRVKEWLSFGLTNVAEVLNFVKMCYMAGYEADDVLLFYSTLTASHELNKPFLSALNHLYKGVEE